MTKKDVESKLEKCITHYKKISEIFDNFEKFVGVSMESPLFLAVFNTFELYVDELKVSINDPFDWINWYIYDNECGKNEHEAKASNWKKAKKIKNVKDLADIIMADWE